MIKIITIIGARPQIIKAAALSRAIKNNFSDKIQEIIIHTGQHYDANMSQVFFDELDIPKPNYNLNVGSGSHGEQTALMLTGIETILLEEKPNAIILYGDTNSTLAGALAASKIQMPIIHIEAGLRSYNKSMPEEINRIMCDHVSTLLFSPTKTGYNSLIKEGFKENSAPPYHLNNPKIYHCGDVMYDNSIYFSEIAQTKTAILKNNNLYNEKFILVTIHRNANTDEPKRLNAIISALNKIATENKIRIIIPLHPRTTKQLQLISEKSYKELTSNEYITLLPPVSFLEMIALEMNAKLIVTDSGGVQKEAFFFKKNCLILRPETEWIELVDCGAAKIVDANEIEILKAYNHYAALENIEYPNLFGDGKAADFICSEIIKHIN